MPIEWVVAGMGAIITVLSGAVAMLWRKHLADDAKREADYADAKGIAASASGNVGTLVPAVRELTAAVETIDKRAVERYDQTRDDIKELRTDFLEEIRRSRRPTR